MARRRPAGEAGEGRVVLLTGAASGIGAYLAGQLVARGHRAMLTDLRSEAVEERAAREGWPADRVRVRALDVRDGEAWERVVAEAVEVWGSLDVLLNVAAYLKPGYVHALDPADVDLHVDTNVKGVMHGTRAAAAVMVGQGRGHVVNVASLAGIAPVPGLALYCATKFAVRGFSLAAAQSLREHGVAVTVVCPDAVDTPMLDLQVDYDEAAITFSGSRPLTAAEVGDTILGDVLRERPLETAIPATRAAMARTVSAFPEIVGRLEPLMRRRGRAQQRRRRRAGQAGGPSSG